MKVIMHLHRQRNDEDTTNEKCYQKDHPYCCVAAGYSHLRGYLGDVMVSAICMINLLIVLDIIA